MSSTSFTFEGRTWHEVPGLEDHFISEDGVALYRIQGMPDLPAGYSEGVGRWCCSCAGELPEEWHKGHATKEEAITCGAAQVYSTALQTRTAAELSAMARLALESAAPP